MAKITVGTGGTLKADSVEGQLQELSTYLQIGEFNALNNPNGIDNIVGNHFQNTGTFSATFTIPVDQAISATGQVIYTANDYLTNFQFLPGTGGTFKSTTCAGCFVEAVIYTQLLERDSTLNPGKYNYVTGTFNSDSTVFSGSINLPVTVTVNESGSIVYTVQEYLLTPIV